jgi:hypothetical protein
MIHGGGGVRAALEFLGSDSDDYLVGVALITAAQKIEMERRTNEIKAQAAFTAGRLAEILSKILR